MPSVHSSGSQTTTVPTEHTLATITDVGVFILYVNVTPMVNDDFLTLLLKKKVLTGGTSTVAQTGFYAHAQSDKIAESLPIFSAFELIVTLNQTAGTSRTFEWEIAQL